ncbi:hypothetical protein GGI42DRAFT_261740 [Trichoderma sp. SZMC 28013]
MSRCGYSYTPSLLLHRLLSRHFRPLHLRHGVCMRRLASEGSLSRFALVVSASGTGLQAALWGDGARIKPSSIKPSPRRVLFNFLFFLSSSYLPCFELSQIKKRDVQCGRPALHIAESSRAQLSFGAIGGGIFDFKPFFAFIVSAGLDCGTKKAGGRRAA